MESCPVATMSLPSKQSEHGGRSRGSTEGVTVRARGSDGASSPQGQMTNSIGSRGGLSAGASQPHLQVARSAQQQHASDWAALRLAAPGLVTRGISDAAESCQETQARMAIVRSITPVYRLAGLGAKRGVWERCREGARVQTAINGQGRAARCPACRERAFSNAWLGVAFLMKIAGESRRTSLGRMHFSSLSRIPRSLLPPCIQPGATRLYEAVATAGSSAGNVRAMASR